MLKLSTFGGFMLKKVLLICMVLGITACARQAVTPDFDPNYNFSNIQQLTIIADDPEGTPSHRHIALLLEQALVAGNIKVTDDSNIKLLIDAYVEERPNDQAISIGLGTGTSTRNSSIGIGTSVQIPIGDDMVEWQVIQLDLVDNNQVIWTARDDAKLKVKDGKGRHEVQQYIIDRLLADFPLTTQQGNE
ncbi:hypothetical protein QTP81_11630 [Alteromonas sp. ASW11-36]|uniref:DUF4136 domain-containing protein n=1 Tax=Alteromonas arenosi TaxID=3055817 RepID=A0ABT7SYI1_9ALTE|nr:DUF4136 domain-containing protein [Alteromonas sp. ASW11-36]MDM7861245.1 hypothetical protein [Alteromonas sp. ASW11-36]